MSRMILEIITPDKKIFSGDVHSVQVPGKKGKFEVLPNHAPIISTLEEGKVRIINTKHEKEYFLIEGGVIEVNKNRIIILAD